MNKRRNVEVDDCIGSKQRNKETKKQTRDETYVYLKRCYINGVGNNSDNTTDISRNNVRIRIWKNGIIGMA